MRILMDLDKKYDDDDDIIIERRFRNGA